MIDQKFKYKIEKLPKSEIKLEVEIEASEIAKAKIKALKKWQADLEIDGFRKGQTPENIVLQKVGEGRILEDAAEILINEYFPKIVQTEKLEILGHPQISIKKLALGNPLEFNAIFFVLPEIELPDFKKICREISEKEKNKEEKIEVSDKEVSEVLLQIRKNKAHYDWHKNNPEDKNHDKHPDYDKEDNLPPLDDELAKAAGNFQNLKELKEKVKENILEDKKYKEIDKKRILIVDELLKKTKIEIPEILIESEVEKSLAQIKDNAQKIEKRWEDYLSHIKKTEDEFRKELKEPAEKRAKIQIIFNKIAEAEKLEPNKEILDNEVKKILEMYPSAKEENARIYVATQLLNQEVLKLLEQQ